ncbi:SRPBCC family protein [Streptomyces sp. NPDC006430]|uniref:SRPBCC family protein n=1 Tax=Streptomyces sp. NPDC006430 TaxID=3154299 RepID=UPI0033AEF8F7
MPGIRIVRQTPLPPSEAWLRLTDWERHGALVPLTRTTVGTAPPTDVGTIFTARTGVGRITFDDPMEVAVWRPPSVASAGLVRLVKRGRVITGWAEIEVRPGPAGGSVVQWHEEVRVRGLGRPFDPLVATAARWVFGRALARLLRP